MLSVIDRINLFFFPLIIMGIISECKFQTLYMDISDKLNNNVCKSQVLVLVPLVTHDNEDDSRNDKYNDTYQR